MTVRLKAGDLVHVPRWGDGRVIGVSTRFGVCDIYITHPKDGRRRKLTRLLNGDHPQVPNNPHYTAALMKGYWRDAIGVLHKEVAHA